MKTMTDDEMYNTPTFIVEEEYINLRREVEYLQGCFLSIQNEIDKFIIDLTNNRNTYNSFSQLRDRLENIKNISPESSKKLYEKFKDITQTSEEIKTILKEFDK